LPAERLNCNEDFRECITREAKEETGADITLEHFVGIYQRSLPAVAMLCLQFLPAA